MKKIITSLLITTLILLHPFQTNAATLYRTSGGNGEVELIVTADTGYVGAMDVNLKLTGNVSLEKVEWNRGLEEKYIKKYTYDKANNMIRIYLATGDAKKNLADADGNVRIGKIKVVAQKESTTFNVELNKLSVTDMDYQTVTKENLTTDGDKDFYYTLIPDDNTEEEENPIPPAEEKPGNSGNNNSGNNNGNNSGNHATDNEENTDSDNEQEEDNQDNEEENKDDEKVPSSDLEINDGEYESSKNNGEKLPLLWICLGSIAAIIAGIGGYILIKNKNKKETSTTNEKTDENKE